MSSHARYPPKTTSVLELIVGFAELVRNWCHSESSAVFVGLIAELEAKLANNSEERSALLERFVSLFSVCTRRSVVVQ